MGLIIILGIIGLVVIMFISLEGDIRLVTEDLEKLFDFKLKLIHQQFTNSVTGTDKKIDKFNKNLLRFEEKLNGLQPRYSLLARLLDFMLA